MLAQYKINKIELKSYKNKESSNARADDNFRKILASDGLTWIQYCFPNITRPETGHEKARTSCNVKNRELPHYARQQQKQLVLSSGMHRAVHSQGGGGNCILITIRLFQTDCQPNYISFIYVKFYYILIFNYRYIQYKSRHMVEAWRIYALD
jgi:hypothetical protein